MATKKKRGPIVVKPGSKEAKQIEDTHGFEAAFKAQQKRDGNAPDEKGDSK